MKADSARCTLGASELPGLGAGVAGHTGSTFCGLQDAFEVGRRFRIMNPDRMRSTYGMLIYMLMDSAEAQIQELLEFPCVRPLRTVYSLLGAYNFRV